MAPSRSALLRSPVPVERPAAVIDPARVRRNIERMVARAARAGVRLRPHFKTHQSAAIGDWFRDYGVRAVTVSSVAMARYFAQHGWDDITLAVPVNLREVEAIDELAGTSDLGLLVDDESAAQALGSALRARVRVWIKIDAGYGRAGVRWDRPAQLLSLARTIGRFPRLRLQGLLTHSGHSYRQTDAAGILRVHEESLARMREARAALAGAGVAAGEISVGDRPTCSLAASFPGVDEIRPGNFVFYDLMQMRLGVCSPDDLALAVACPVIGRYPDRERLLLYGGTVHLSSERLSGEKGEGLFGCLAGIGVSAGAGANRDSALGIPDLEMPLLSLTQEHGMARVPGSEVRAVEIGEMVLVYPVHACITAHLYRAYLDGKGEPLGRR